MTGAEHAYDIVRRSDGRIMGSIALDSDYLVYSRDGIISCRPLLEDEGIFNLSTGASFLRSLGYRVTPPSDIILSAD